MNQLTTYLSRPKTKSILAKKPGEEGFSLIELVVVVAVLAILAAIAIPAFTSINDKARASAASNTLATVVKECAVKLANGGGSFNTFKPDGYASVTGAACATTGTITLTVSPTNAELPSFTYNFGTGEKTCSPNKQNCVSGIW